MHDEGEGEAKPKTNKRAKAAMHDDEGEGEAKTSKRAKSKTMHDEGDVKPRRVAKEPAKPGNPKVEPASKPKETCVADGDTAKEPTERSAASKRAHETRIVASQAAIKIIQESGILEMQLPDGFSKLKLGSCTNIMIIMMILLHVKFGIIDQFQSQGDYRSTSKELHSLAMPRYRQQGPYQGLRGDGKGQWD